MSPVSSQRTTALTLPYRSEVSVPVAFMGTTSRLASWRGRASFSSCLLPQSLTYRARCGGTSSSPPKSQPYKHLWANLNALFLIYRPNPHKLGLHRGSPLASRCLGKARCAWATRPAAAALEGDYGNCETAPGEGGALPDVEENSQFLEGDEVLSFLDRNRLKWSCRSTSLHINGYMYNMITRPIKYASRRAPREQCSLVSRQSRVCGACRHEKRSEREKHKRKHA